MAKSKNLKIISALAGERYLIWAIIFAISVGGGLLAQIYMSKIQMDTDISSSLYLVNIKHK
ncbi:MAG TPA: hypothetical protein VF974_03020 [Patescibacteria group bacterium]